jgi:hypothetical protein
LLHEERQAPAAQTKGAQDCSVCAGQIPLAGQLAGSAAVPASLQAAAAQVMPSLESHLPVPSQKPVD